MARVFSVIAGVCAVVAPLPAPGPARAGDGRFDNVACEGTYPKHLQGICTDDKDSIFWCFTDVLVKTNPEGRVVKRIPVASHHGDLCYRDGKVYVAVNLGKFNEPSKKAADSWVYVYRAADLSEVARHKTPELVYGAGGIACDDRRFLVVGGLPVGVEENYAYEYDSDFRFIRRHEIRSGYTEKGIQTATYSDGFWWFGCYGKPRVLLKTDKSLKLVGRHTFDCSLGIVGLTDKSLLVARGTFLPGKGHTAKAFLARADAQEGLAIREGSAAGSHAPSRPTRP